MPTFTPARRTALGLALVAALAVAAAWPYFGYVAEDVYLTLRYGWNLVNGRGLVFNQGERIEGFTSFSWTLLAALPHALGLDAVTSLRAVALAAHAATAVGAVALARQLGAIGPPWRELSAYAAGVAVAVHPALGLEAMSALETPLFAALATWAMVAALADWPRAAFWCLAAATLTRWEGHLLWLVVVPTAAAVAHRRGHLLRVAGLVEPLVIVSLYHFARLLYYEALVPNHHRAHSAAGAFAWDATATLTASLSVGPGWGLAALALLGLVLLHDARALAVLAAAAVPVIVLLWSGHDPAPLGRTAAPTWPLLAGLAGAGLALALDHAARWLRAVANALAVLAALAAAVAAFLTTRAVAPPLLAAQAARLDAQDAVGALLAQAPAGSLVAFPAPNLVPYVAIDQRFLDLTGRVSTSVAHALAAEGVSPAGALPRPGETRAQAVSDAAARIRAVVFEAQPAAIGLVAVPDPQRPGQLWFEYSWGLNSDPRLERGYRPLQVFEAGPAWRAVVYQRADAAAAN